MVDTLLVKCKHYDTIVNFRYPAHDYISEKLIHAYQDYLFETQRQEKTDQMAIQLDQILSIYVKNKGFYKYVQNYYLKDERIAFGDLTDLIALYHDYVKEEMKQTVSTKWI